MAKSKSKKRENISPPDVNTNFINWGNISDAELDGSILGKPDGYNAATGQYKQSLRRVGEQMLRNDHDGEDHD